MVFLLTLVNFILIVYNFAILKVPLISSFLNLPLFVIVFFLIYVPLAIIIGYWHRRNQYAVENEALLQENWIWAWISLYQIRLIKGKTTSTEDLAVITYLHNILKRTKKDDLLELATKNRDNLTDKQ
ncbi:MAG TPA: hypothetical protein VFK40_05710 [Nitrososphaeraceae archaeon]|nr:hypothetical protein [Nitrososphaeraceae archaeon]